jgi:hypothetical protein
MVGLPTSTLYELENGVLKRTPRYGVGEDAELLPTGNYALVYTKNIGKYGNTDMEAKVIAKINGETKFKLIHSDDPRETDPIFLRRKVENDILSQLINATPQQSLSRYTIERKKTKKTKPKSKRCKCKLLVMIYRKDGDMREMLLMVKQILMKRNIEPMVKLIY